MSAGTHAYVWCDHFDKEAPEGQRICQARVEEGSTRAEGRRIAKKLGWTVNVRINSTEPYRRKGGDGSDYCPVHKPGGNPAP